MLSSSRSFSVATCLALGALLTLPGRASATSNFPGAIKTHLDAAKTPDCSVCHNGPQQRGTVTTGFGKAMLDRNLVAYEEDSLNTALDALAAEKRDSNGDGVTDIDALKAGDDPNVAADGTTDDSGAVAPQYGCAARGPGSGCSVGWLGLVAVVVGLRRRFRA